MPYKSRAQQAKFHQLLKEGKISKEKVDEYDKASAGKKLPERITMPKAPKIKSIQQIREIAKKMK